MKKALQLLLFFSFILLFSCKSLEPVSNPTAQAYKIQNQMVSDSGKTIVGYKAGLTSKAGQAKFGVSEPVAGVLFADGLSKDRQVYVLENYQRLMLETEIGFVLNSDIRFLPTVPTPEYFASYIKEVVPVIELPDLAYPDMNKVTGLKLIETNVASNQVLIGKGVPFEQINLNAITTKLSKNGETVIQGKATDAMGDQLNAIQFLILTMHFNGYQLKEGDILITGALGKMIPAERGQYDADFGNLGSLSFSIR